jgi:RHS repeat-associated protein
MIDVTDSNAVYYYHFDGLGSVVALSDVNSDIVEIYSYDVFGEPNITSSVGNPYLFTGRRYDPEAGLYYYRARYYAHDIGRFLQPDPIGYDDGLNTYTGFGNNPISFGDPLGLCKGDQSFGRKLWEGDYVGTGYGESSLDLYAQKIAFGDAKWYHYAGGFFSALWTPKTWRTTAVTVGTAGYGAVKARIAARSTRLISQTGGLSDDIANTFRNASYKTRVLKNNVTAYRYSGGKSLARGRWLTTRQTVGRINTKGLNVAKELALPKGATAENLTTFTIPKGAKIYTGRIAGGGLKATQIFIENASLLIP